MSEESEKQQAREDLAAILNLAAGKRFVFWLLEHCGIYRLSYDGENALAFNEGQRSVGLRLIGEMNELHPACYASLLAENIRWKADRGTPTKESKVEWDDREDL
jgi:hypothetical protein